MFSRPYRELNLMCIAMTPATQAPANDGLVGGDLWRVCIGGALLMTSGSDHHPHTKSAPVNPHARRTANPGQGLTLTSASLSAGSRMARSGNVARQPSRPIRLISGSGYRSYLDIRAYFWFAALRRGHSRISMMRSN